MGDLSDQRSRRNNEVTILMIVRRILLVVCTSRQNGCTKLHNIMFFVVL